jgi:hypothetical protein
MVVEEEGKAEDGAPATVGKVDMGRDEEKVGCCMGCEEEETA